MVNVTVCIDEHISDAEKEIISEKISFSVPNLERCHWEDSTKVIHLQAGSGDPKTIEMIVLDIIDGSKLKRPVTKATMYTTQANSDVTKQNTLLKQSDGDNWLDHDIYNLRQSLKSQIVEKFKTFNPRGYFHSPSRLKMTDLEKSDYPQHFPQNLYSVHYIPHDHSSFNRLESGEGFDEVSCPSGLALTPAACLGLYPQLPKSVEEDQCWIVYGRCFRHEPEWRVSSVRKTEFDMLELVFLGSSEYVEAKRLEALKMLSSFLAGLGIASEVTSAFDSFALSSNSLKTNFQLLSKTKFELIVPSHSSDGPFAVASFNYVADTLTNAFGIARDDGTSLCSGCAAVGIDRLAEAVLEFQLNSTAEA